MGTDDVAVPRMNLDAYTQLDELIMSCADASWRKVALIIMRVLKAHGEDGETSIFLIIQRMRKLIAAQKLEARGNIWSPRYSEVRLLQSKQD